MARESAFGCRKKFWAREYDAPSWGTGEDDENTRAYPVLCPLDPDSASKQSQSLLRWIRGVLNN